MNLPDREQKKTYAAMVALKKMDLAPEDGGMTFPVVLPSELSPLDEVLEDLAVADLISINAKKERYELTRQGLDYLGRLIDEAEEMVDELDELETDEAIAELRKRKQDLFRARFLWGWYEGEFDDLVAFQEQRGVTPVETLWAFYLLSDDFYRELGRELDEASDA
jgi:hypothetical protein